MLNDAQIEPIRGRILIRLQTLVRLRWFAISGQAIAVLAVQFAFGFPFPWQVSLFLVGISALLNVMLMVHARSTDSISAERIFSILTFDTVQLGALLYLTGGLQNPFAILLMAPPIVSATSLKLNHTLFLGALTVFIATALELVSFPLPWWPGERFEPPFIYLVGLWVGIVCTLGFTTIYAFRVAEEARSVADALTATELVLQREQHLSALDGLAAAAAHELGTPLATIAVVSKEMVNSLPDDSPLKEDALLLRSQADRCRDILQKITSLSSDGADVLENMAMGTLLEELVAPLREFGITLTVKKSGNSGNEPGTIRNPTMLYGLGNLVDNAVDFAKTEVLVEADWDVDTVRLSIKDDGRGFSNSVLNRIGQPFISSRSKPRDGRKQGMGLGLFIAKTLLERSGGKLEFSNKGLRSETGLGACIDIVWERSTFEGGGRVASAS